jgi:hypothetical protein
MARTSSWRPLKANDELRAATRIVRRRLSVVMISSVMPSERKSFRGSEVRLVNGSTATDGRSPSPVVFPRFGEKPRPATVARDTEPPLSVIASSFANAPAVAGRSSGSNDSAAATASSTWLGTSGQRVATLGASWVNRWAISAWVLRAEKGTAPQSIS